MSKIQWRLVIMISLSGLVFAGLTIFALIPGKEQLVVILMLFAIAVSMTRLAPGAPMRNAFAAGFLTALLAVWTQAAFLPLYFENNPSYSQIAIPFGLSPVYRSFKHHIA
jgi:hypothetical protein